MNSGSRSRKKKKRILIIGAGASGMSCAATLAEHPERFDVTIIERRHVVGGRATSRSIDGSKYGADWFNDGVQGGTILYRHAFKFFRKYGYEPQEVKLQFAYGKGKDNFWTNVFPTPLVERFPDEIRKFKKVMKLIRRMPSVLGLIPLRVMFTMFGFKKEFIDKMVIPMLSIYLGTEHQTSNVTSLLLLRLFEEPNMELWKNDPDSLLFNMPSVFTFPNMGDFYRDWSSDLRRKGVSIRLNTEAIRVVQRNKDGIVLHTRLLDADPRIGGDETNGSFDQESFDDMVLCIFAHDALRVLDGQATRTERFVLSNERFYHDTTVVHTDYKYIQRMYESKFKPELSVTPKNQEQRERVEFGRSEPRSQEDGWSGYQPMYYMHSYGNAPGKLEISYDCTTFQHQFRQNKEFGQPPPPFDRRIFQTIFLDMRQNHRWTIGQIDERKIIERRWSFEWKRGWRHYAKTIPGMILINGSNHTYFAGNGSLADLYELSCMSGIAAAYRLGANYEKFDSTAEKTFASFLKIFHGVRYRSNIPGG
ncbi:hypothetical protein FQN54_008558 [Arachnomyces sp. PD_36]|nr:hypothetical protein FQN54_008558 [Arachnomyces sp. PD_36]